MISELLTKCRLFCETLLFGFRSRVVASLAETFFYALNYCDGMLQWLADAERFESKVLSCFFFFQQNDTNSTVCWSEIRTFTYEAMHVWLYEL